MKITQRENKGTSLLTIPTSYTVIDIETTGLDPRWDEIIELAAIQVRDGQIFDRFATLVQPNNPISDFVSQLTGITNEAASSAPKLQEVLPGFLDFIGNDILVGHNVHFDVNFIYDASVAQLNKPLTNDMVDTLRLSRRILPALSHHKLVDVAAALGVDQAGAHRSLVDCETTHSVLQALAAKADTEGITFVSGISNSSHGVKASEVSAQEGHADPDSPLYGKVCVFTGTLEKMLRKDAMQLVANIGGICADGVTAKTNFLILGNNDYCASIKGGKSSKQKKAEALILKGNDLQILSESVFYDLVL